MVSSFSKSGASRGMRTLIYAFMMVLCLGAVVHGDFQPIEDVPYPEIVAHRFTAQFTTPIYEWGTVPWSKAVQVVAGVVGGLRGAFIVEQYGSIYFSVGPAGTRLLTVSHNFGGLGRLLVDENGELRATVLSNAVISLNCTLQQSYVLCSTGGTTMHMFGAINDAALVSANPLTLYIASNGGLSYFQNGIIQQLNTFPTLSVAYSPTAHIAAAGTSDFVYIYSDTTLVSQEWVTDLANAWGGAYDAPALAMAFDSQGTLYLANTICVNVRHPNASISRIDWLQGLPVNETTSIAVDDAAIWVGTTRGVCKQNRDTGDWQYFYRERYLPGKSDVVDLALSGPSAYVITDGGMAILETQMWTLAQKAAHYEDILLRRHDRIGLVDSCDMTSFGNLSSCTCHDSDNNGLWTSVVVAAEAFRYATTGNPDAKDAALHFYGGLQLLNAIPGIPGLMARSATRPGEKHSDGGQWHNSTVPMYAGWQWKGDTSSDEVVGHMFALPLMSQLVLNTYQNSAAVLVNNIISYIVRNNFYLVDVTGQHTLWGVWNPREINFGRNYSDERGVNSLQLLTYLLQAKFLSNDPFQIFTQAYVNLTSPTNHYATNTINAKIESPDDDNYSDDELTFLPYYTLFSAPPGPDDAVLRLGFQRTWKAVRSLRSNLWNSIYVAMGGTDAEQSDIDSIAWNLRTWPLDLISWPTRNSHRRDLRFDIDADRFGNTNGDSVRVLPANERTQERWNGNPHDLDGGSGMTEADPGAWLLPYWLARYHGIIRS